MAEFKIEILKPAWAELDEIASYHYQMVEPKSAKKITDKILDALQRLADFPLSCPYVPDEELKSEGYRMLICGVYLCIYRLIDNVVYVYQYRKRENGIFKTVKVIWLHLYRVNKY